MSRIGKAPIPLPDSVDFKYDNAIVTVKGPKGELTQRVPREMMVEVGDGVIQVKRPTDSGQHRSLHGLTRTLIANMVAGVTKGFERKLELVGVGYRASLQGPNLSMALGYSHPIIYPVPSGIKIEVKDQTQITVSGMDKQQVGAVAAKLRSFRPPEPYKGKGVKYAEERIRRKAGKAGGAK